VSKTPAKRTAPAKAVKPAPPAAAKKIATAKSVKPAAKSVKPTAKSVVKPAARPAATHIAAAHAAPPPAAKAAPTRTSTPVTRSTPPADKTTTPAKSSGSRQSAAAKAHASMLAASVKPVPSVPRFADRFSPVRPPARGTVVPTIDAPRSSAKPDPKLANAWKTKSGRDLSEAEMLAMPDSEYMNDKQLEFFRARLQALKDDLLSNAGETTEHLREDTSIVPDPADRATIEEEHALELRTRDRERKLLKKISQSLTRIESGDYGYCDETGEPIGLARLLARPTATLSLEAQQRRELKQKMFGD
jgi:DnaK suppressor protein